MPHMELRGNTYYATLHVPKDVRAALGKSKLIQSLKTSDKRLAHERSLSILLEWKGAIREARSGTTDTFTANALEWKKDHENATGEDQETISHLITDKADALEEKYDVETAKAFAAIALGYRTPITPQIPQWETSLAPLAPKTRAVYVPTIKKLAARFKTLETINSRAVRAWIISMQQEEQLSGKSIQRILGACTNFWRWLQARDMVDIDATPFKGHNIKVKSKSYIPFKPEEVATLWRMALEKDDQPLADLIQLGAYTGARIEELGQLQVKHVTKLGSLLVPGTKTDAALREVPIHTSIQATIERLVSGSKDNFLIPSSAKNSRGNRSDPLSKSFGRLKGQLGYAGDRTRVFHSIRKTLTTLLENAGVSEGIAADIVGHEKQTMTYGLYSSGNSLDVKREALNKVVYPGGM